MTEVPLLELRDIRKSYAGGRPALDGVTVGLRGDRPSLVTLAGESGCGKSTLAATALGLLPPDGGAALWRGGDIYARGGRPENFRREVQAVFQNPFEAFNPFYRVDRILKLTIRKFALAGNRDGEQAMIHAALAAVHLDPARILGRFPHQLSGGQLQRLSIARAILPRPRLLIADEPVSMIDASLRLSILAHLVELKTRFGISILYITHDLSTARLISDEIVILKSGKVVERGPPDEVVLAPREPYTRQLVAAIPKLRTRKAEA